MIGDVKWVYDFVYRTEEFILWRGQWKGLLQELERTHITHVVVRQIKVFEITFLLALKFESQVLLHNHESLKWALAAMKMELVYQWILNMEQSG